MPVKGSRRQKWLNELDRINYELRQMIQRLAVAMPYMKDPEMHEEARSRCTELSQGLDAVISLRDWIRITEGL